MMVKLGEEEDAGANEMTMPDADVVVSENLATVRAFDLDALAAILPAERRERMSTVLTDDDIATLRHLAREGIGRNTLRAVASDLNYLEAWALAATGNPLPWPAPEALALKFVAHHLYDGERRIDDPSHGMPGEVAALLRSEGCLRSDGPHAPATVRRRIALWATLHRWRSLEGPFSAPSVRGAMRLAVSAAKRPRGRKSAHPVTRDVLDRLLDTCVGGGFADVRDRALLLVAFGSGGRRRSEIATLKVGDIVERPPVPEHPVDAASGLVPALALRLGRTKTAGLEQDERVILTGRPVEALRHWLTLSGIGGGAVFRSIDRFGRLGARALDGQSVNAILKKRCRMAGLPEELFSAHGLRSGYLTEAARRGVPLQEAMRQSRHRSVNQAASYYNEVEIERSVATRLA